MIIPTFQCDECGEEFSHEPPVILHGDFSTRNGGILLPRREWHFCTKDCTEVWLEKASLKQDRERLNKEQLRKFCQPEREPKGK